VGEECVVSAALRFAVENIGRTCIDITSIDAKVGNESPRDLALNMSNNAMFCPNDVLVFVETRLLDLCQHRGLFLPVVLRINGDFDASGSLSFLTTIPTAAPFSFSKLPSMIPAKAPSNPPIESSLIPVRNTFSSNPSVLVPGTNKPSDQNKICFVRPTAVWLLFEPRICKDGNGWSFKKEGRKIKSKSKKHVTRSKGSTKIKTGCIDICPVASSSRLLITSKVGSTLIYDGIVTEGQKIKITDPSAQGLGKVHVHTFNLDGKKSQSFTFDLSCHKPTRVGYVYASLTFVGFSVATH